MTIWVGVGAGAGAGICLELKPEPKISKMGGSGNTDKKTGLLLVFLSDRTCVDNTVGQPFFYF